MYNDDDMADLLNAADNLAAEVENLLKQKDQPYTNLVLALNDFRMAQVRALEGLGHTLDELSQIEDAYQTPNETLLRAIENEENVGDEENEESVKYSLHADRAAGNIDIIGDINNLNLKNKKLH